MLVAVNVGGANDMLENIHVASVCVCTCIVCSCVLGIFVGVLLHEYEHQRLVSIFILLIQDTLYFETGLIEAEPRQF